MHQVVFAENELSNSLPQCLYLLSELWRFFVNDNKLNGTIAMALGPTVELLSLSHNQFSGSIPEQIGQMMTSEALHFNSNKLTGCLPESCGRVRRLNSIFMGHNFLSGSLPRAMGRLSMQIVHASGNNFEGALPGSLQGAKTLILNSNSFTGSIPHGMGRMASLKQLLLDMNMLTGTLPVHLGALKSLEYLVCGDNALEGALPASLVGLQKLSFLVATGNSTQQVMQGNLPSQLSRMPLLCRVVLQEHRLQGPIPSFPCTLDALVLHHNILQTLPKVVHFKGSSQMKHGAVVLLHRNRLSGELPADNISKVQTALVGAGNHLMYPRRSEFPSWVSPWEQDGLFWVDRHAFRSFVLRTLVASMAFAMVLQCKVGWTKYLSVTCRWHVVAGPNQQLVLATTSLFSRLASHVLGSCLWLVLVLNNRYYTCPAFLVLATACLSESPYALSTVTLLWSRLVKEASSPFWMPAHESDSQSIGWRYWSICRLVLWASWVLLSLLLSTLAAIDVTAMCAPALFGLRGDILNFLHAIIGSCQALLSGLVIPCLARCQKIIRKPSLVRT